jgi:hypothetical protein
MFSKRFYVLLPFRSRKKTAPQAQKIFCALLQYGMPENKPVLSFFQGGGSICKIVKKRPDVTS